MWNCPLVLENKIFMLIIFTEYTPITQTTLEGFKKHIKILYRTRKSKV